MDALRDNAALSGSLAPHLSDPLALVPTENLRTAPRPLEDVIGPSNGRIGMERHLKRVKFFHENIPESIWPTLGAIQDKFAGGTAIVVGGGPSAARTVSEVKRIKDKLGPKARIFAPNKSHDWLIARGIVPDFGILMDPSEHVAEYITPHPGVIYLLGTTLHWKCFKRFLDARSHVFTFTPIHDPELSDVRIIPEMFPERNHTFIPGGSTVGLRALEIAISMNMDIHAHGFDSCFAPKTKTLYAYDKPYQTTELADAIAVSERNGKELRFRGNHHMAKQMLAFQQFMDMWPYKTVNGSAYRGTLTMHGDGVIPWMVWNDGAVRMQHAAQMDMRWKYKEWMYYDYAEDKPVEKSMRAA